ncbi:MAG: NACHT domain-containing protein [Spirulinaceae cyanobacterium]
MTIITYLYTETTFVLPHSRAEFYEKATNMLLELRDQERNIKDSLNRYSTVAKRQVLRRLALVAQDTLNPENPDRRSITRQVVWREVGQVLPDLNLAVEETGGILQEIIARSGLLLEIDGGERFQFAHLTLQEFFAAAALQNDQVGLIERFERDAVAWREVVKLWCGLVGNSTELIRAIYKQDELLAFECLAEAQEVEQALADEIFERMKGELERAATEDEVAKAFGSVAADTQKPRGKTTLEFLQEQLRKAPDTATRIAAAKGLSMTNLPESAYVLAEHYQDSMDNIVSAPLVRMGDIAVEPVYGAARKGYLEAIDDLFCIHTPRVAQELTRLIWNKDEQLASRAAWRLAAMLEKSNVEQELTTIEGLPDFGYGEFDWIWLPFTTSQKSNLCVIAGQLVKLISANSELPEMMASADSEKKGIDLRLLVPICVFSDNGIKRFSISEEKAKKVERLLEQRGSHVGTGIEFNLNVDQLLNSAKVEHSWKILLESKNPFLRVDLTYRLSDQYREIEKQDWLNIFKKNTFDFSRSRMYWVILIIAFIASVGAIAQILLFMMQQPENPLNGLMAIANIAIFVYCLSVWQGIEERFELNTFDKLGFFGILTLWRESKSLLFTKKTLWQGVRLVWKALFSVFENRTESERKLLDFLFLVGVGFGLTSLSFFSSVLMTMAVSNFGFIFGILIGAKFRFYELKTMGFRVEFKFNIVNLNWAIFVCAAVTGFMIWTVNGSVAEALGWITGSLFGRGIGIWNEAYENQQLEHPEPIPLWQKLIALCAFPLYCWFPITTVFFLLGLKNLLTTLNTPHPWWFATGIWLTLFITCCILWVWGQRKDRAARNPLHGILDDYYPQYKMQRNP